jgi:hypothetical protein
MIVEYIRYRSAATLQLAIIEAIYSPNQLLAAVPVCIVW